MNRSSILGVCLLLLGSCSGDAPSPASEVAAETSIRIVDHEGLEQAIAEREGRGYLLNFWAMWCAPCVAELPELVETGHEYRERGGSVIGISYDLMVADADEIGIEDATRKFLEGRHLDMPVLIYDDADYERINERFDLPGEVPVTLAIDKHGKIVDRQHGSADKARFDEMMRKALGL